MITLRSLGTMIEHKIWHASDNVHQMGNISWYSIFWGMCKSCKVSLNQEKKC